MSTEFKPGDRVDYTYKSSLGDKYTHITPGVVKEVCDNQVQVAVYVYEEGRKMVRHFFIEWLEPRYRYVDQIDKYFLNEG